jgi:ubiquinone/menaquinone biosynthesis C-methylase UbiE
MFKWRKRAVAKSSIADTVTQEYWNEYNVTLHHQFKDVGESLDFFHWRNDQYFGYIERMPVRGFDDKIVLDYGCGPGHDLVGFSVYSNTKELIGADISRKSLAEAHSRLKLHDSPAELVLLDKDASSLPFKDATFDHIHSSGVLHHAPDIDILMLELWRVLKPGGTFNVMVYNYNSLWMHLFVAYHKRIVEAMYNGMTLRQGFTKTTDSEDCPIANCYTPEEFLSISKRAGFEGQFAGAAISMHELTIAPARFVAVQSRQLPAECRRFLLSLEVDRFGYPTYDGHYAGIDACFHLAKPRA